MASTICAICIVVLFSGWVWTLKTELEQTRDNAGGAPEAGRGQRTSPEWDMARATPPATTVKPSATADRATVHRREDGVPTWTIS